MTTLMLSGELNEWNVSDLAARIAISDENGLQITINCFETSGYYAAAMSWHIVTGIHKIHSILILSAGGNVVRELVMLKKEEFAGPKITAIPGASGWLKIKSGMFEFSALGNPVGYSAEQAYTALKAEAKAELELSKDILTPAEQAAFKAGETITFSDARMGEIFG